MRLSLDEHHKQNWRVADLAPDFEVLDVWRFPVVLDNETTLAQFIEFMELSQREMIAGRGAAASLFRLRAVMGRIFGWDERSGGKSGEKSKPLAIPGCHEVSIRDRLSEKDLARTREQEVSGTDREPVSSFRRVYSWANESLTEISNKTVHALMHLGRVPISDEAWSPQMAVFVKSRGSIGSIYMKLIAPFRHYIVYPAMMRAAKRGWPAYAAQHLAGRDTLSR